MSDRCFCGEIWNRACVECRTNYCDNHEDVYLMDHYCRDCVDILAKTFRDLASIDEADFPYPPK